MGQWGRSRRRFARARSATDRSAIDHGATDHGATDRHATPLLRDPGLHAAVRDDGYAVVPGFLGRDRCDELTGDCERLLADVDVGTTWFTSGMIERTDLRREVFDTVGSALRPALEPLLVPGAVDVIAGHFHINPPRSTGGLGPHQDVAIVDESDHFSLNGWIPLSDVDLSNGTLQVVPRSHHLGNRDRSLAVPWAFEGLHDTFWALSEPLVVPAGSLVLFDTAMVHCSAANDSDVARVAVNCLLKPAAAPMIHLVADEQTVPGQVESYEVPVDFYIGGDLSARPDPGRSRHLGAHPIADCDPDPASIRRRCAPGADGPG